MPQPPVPVERLPVFLRPDPSRVLIRPFLGTAGGGPPSADQTARLLRIIARVLALGEAQVAALLEQVFVDFGERHQEIRRFFLARFEQVRSLLPTDEEMSEPRKLLLGSFFTNEYSLESAALFNPCMVPHPDGAGETPEGGLRFILSLRATGEGHVSSITFRSGMITPDLEVEIDAPSRFVTESRPTPDPQYERALFARKLVELNLATPFARRVMEALGVEFTFDALRRTLASALRQTPGEEENHTAQRMLLLARSNYEVQFDASRPVSERVIFPYSPSQSNGIEDARFVRFTEADGRVCYYATYTAYDGRVVLPQMLESPDFLKFGVCTLNGPAAMNKGMALFPRRIGGAYAMLSRQDNENIHVMFSDHLHFWHESRVILKPRFAWEFVQLGNCGSPLETERGWLVLSHGVGPMRKYAIGAFLLDLDDPTRVIGRLREPLLTAERQEREGYVPNVVYSCGGVIHRGHLILPYALADSVTTFARVPLGPLLDAMK
jgi:predicted GH43/DUF377 family glycosyl hydrolase